MSAIGKNSIRCAFQCLQAVGCPRVKASHRKQSERRQCNSDLFGGGGRIGRGDGNAKIE